MTSNSKSEDTLREQIKACVSLATFKHNTALNDAGFQMDIDAIVDQILSLIEEEKNKYQPLDTEVMRSKFFAECRANTEFQRELAKKSKGER